jgi:hypothetical protein
LVYFEDFKLLAKDEEIPLADAIDYAINDGDVKLSCSCPSFLYFYSYKASQLKYKLGLPERRPAKRNNPGLAGSVCKHIHRVIMKLENDKGTIADYFKRLYRKDIQKEVDMEKARSKDIQKAEMAEMEAKPESEE